MTGATHVADSGTDEMNSNSNLGDAASKAMIDMAHDVHTVSLTDDQIARMLSGDDGADIASNKTGVVNEQIEISEYADGDNAGKVEK